MAAEGDVNYQQPQEQMEAAERLKYLGFVQVAAIHAVVTFSNLYLYAKEKSGPLKPSVENVEGAVKTVVGPVFNKYHGLPVGLLKFVDRKVDDSVSGLDRRVPPVVKQVSAKAITAARMAPVTARAVASEVQQAGFAKTVYTKCEPVAKEIYSKYEPIAKELYSKYEPKAEQCAVSAWRRLNQLPLFPHVAQVVVLTAAYWAERYNQTVRSTAEKGYKVSTYMPTVPTERIAKVFSNEAPAAASLDSN